MCARRLSHHTLSNRLHSQMGPLSRPPASWRLRFLHSTFQSVHLTDPASWRVPQSALAACCCETLYHCLCIYFLHPRPSTATGRQVFLHELDALFRSLHASGFLQFTLLSSLFTTTQLAPAARIESLSHSSSTSRENILIGSFELSVISAFWTLS
jgi:hypothetical protein